MRSDSVVVLNPTFCQDLYFIHIFKPLAVEKFIAHSGIEALAIAVFPRASRLDKSCDDACVLEPFLDFIYCIFIRGFSLIDIQIMQYL